MPLVRPATVDDFDEIARLAPLLWDWPGMDPNANDWQSNARTVFTDGLANNTMNCFVAEHPSEAELIAYGIGVIYQVMPAVWIPNGRMGYMQWFLTHEQWRRQGLAEAIANGLIEWFDRQQVTRIHLHATEAGVPLYRKLGFEEIDYENLWLRK